MHTAPSSPVLLQIDFPFHGPWGDAMAQALGDLATAIASTAGLLWKAWTESPDRQRAGGVYLFVDADAARSYLAVHTARLASFGIDEVRAVVFDVNETLSAQTRFPGASAARAPAFTVEADLPVANLDRFLEVFSTRGAAIRQRHGSRRAEVFHMIDEPAERVRVLLDWADRESFECFRADPQAKDAMRDGGAQAAPTFAPLRRLASLNA